LNDNALLGWIEPKLVVHEANAPSLLRRILQSSNLVRQAIYAALAFDHVEQAHHPVLRSTASATEMSDLSLLLRSGRASEIIASVYGIVPQGFLAALERCGASPLRPASYVRLFMIFASGDVSKAKALRHIDKITDQSIQVVEELLPILLDGKVVSRMMSRAQVRDINESVTFIKRVCSRASDAAVEQAIRNLEPHSKIETIIARFVKRADRFPPQPLDADDEIAPLDTVKALTFASYRYRNCLNRHVGRAITGSVAYAEFRGNLLLELQPLANGAWLLTGVHGHENGLVDPDEEQAAKDKCASLGVSHMLPEGTNSGGWNAVARITNHWDWVVQPSRL
jgi:hypothetical protein